MSRLDVAKMAVEEFVRQWRKRQSQHVRILQELPAAQQRSLLNVGLGGSGGVVSAAVATATAAGATAGSGNASLADGGGSGGSSFLHQQPDSLLLLSTAVPQHADADTSSCAAGGRLLVSFAGSSTAYSQQSSSSGGSSGMADNSAAAVAESISQQYHQEMMEAFQKELKGLQCYSKWDGPSSGRPFPDEAGGANGLNAALSAGLQLLSRYRLHNRWTENFGMGRFTSTASMTPTAAGNAAITALQPACLIVLTDGACLRQSPKDGGGSLQLQYGSQPLRELYNEPFRWDQRIFCLGIGGPDSSSNSSGADTAITSSQYLVRSHGRLALDDTSCRESAIFSGGIHLEAIVSTTGARTAHSRSLVSAPERC
jgi:hypothetical protein